MDPLEPDLQKYRPKNFKEINEYSVITVNLNWAKTETIK